MRSSDWDCSRRSGSARQSFRACTLKQPSCLCNLGDRPDQRRCSREGVRAARQQGSGPKRSKRLASVGKTVSLAGEPLASRIVVSVFDSLEAAQRAYTSPEYLEARRIGDKYGRLGIFAVEGLAQ